MGIGTGNPIRKICEKILRGSGHVPTKDLRKQNGSLTNIKAEFKVEVVFNDFRDWFLLEKDKLAQEDIHQVELKVYANDSLLVGKRMVPINFRKIKLIASFGVTEPIYFSTLRWVIEEMGMSKVAPLDVAKWVNPEDIANFNTDFNLEL